MSSAPANNETDDPNDDLPPPDYDEYADAARHTEEFLASFMHNSDDCSDEEPVHITANMMSSADDDMWLLASDQNDSSPPVMRDQPNNDNDKTLTSSATPSLDPCLTPMRFMLSKCR